MYTRISSPERSCDNTCEKIQYHFTCVWYDNSAANTSLALSCHLVRLMNEQQSLNHSQSKIVCWNFFGLWLLTHWKIPIAYRQWCWNFPRRGGKPKYKRKTKSYVFSGFGNGISHSWEQKSTTGRFVTGWLWPCTWKISSVGKDQFNNWQRILYIENLAHCLFCSDSMHVFILSVPENFKMYQQI